MPPNDQERCQHRDTQHLSDNCRIFASGLTALTRCDRATSYGFEADIDAVSFRAEPVRQHGYVPGKENSDGAENNDSRDGYESNLTGFRFYRSTVAVPPPRRRYCYRRQSASLVCLSDQDFWPKKQASMNV